MNDGTDLDIGELVRRRISRRAMLRGIAAAAVVPVVGCSAEGRARSGSTLRFRALENRLDRSHRVAEGYDASVLIRWGDPVVKGAPAYRPDAMDAASQRLQFGYDNDFTAFMPLPRGSASSARGMLCVNHEDTRSRMMWRRAARVDEASRDQVEAEMAAHGMSFVEVELADGRWRVVADSELNRRLTASTPMRVAGPAAGHARMRTSDDPSGQRVLGTIGNCAGGVTPWGTVLTAEENFDNYFLGDPAQAANADRLRAYGFGAPEVGWGRHAPRFDVEREPNEPNRFGWIVEVDPYDPASTPTKRTALGRAKHEGAAVHRNHDDRIVVYSGDDEVFEYVYRYVSRGRWDGAQGDGGDLLDDGTLYVAKFGDDGVVTWLPLVYGEGPLTPANGFDSQGEVLIDTRRAADLVGATRMDRPEGIAVDPRSGRVFVVLTANPGRRDADVDAANPRAGNRHGHILVLTPPAADGEQDHAAASFEWDVFLLAGDPGRASDGARYHDAVDADGWFSNPDNCVFDPAGRLWIATDQGYGQTHSGIPDGLRVCDVDGDDAARTRLFFAVPFGAECSGPSFTPDGTTLFVSVQHPGSDRGATYENVITRWPDFDPAAPPRPSVVAIRRDDGGVIAT